MNIQELIDTANAMMAKGLLAMDESIATCNRRFAELKIPQTEEYRRNYREILVTTPNLGSCLSGAILSDETIRQHTSDGTSFVEILLKSGIIPGIKVDKSAKDMAGFPGEKITEGLDGLRERLKEYKDLGARFAKWRAVIKIGDDIPTRGCIEANANSLACYAALCQEAGIVPMVEPEVLMDGIHTIERCASVTEEVHRSLFHQLYEQRVNLQGIILKPNMILPGKDCPVQVDDVTIANATIACFLRSVPAAVPGIAFLSGGQPSLKATSRLNAMHSKNRSPLPWSLTFSFSRAIEYPAIEIWSGNKDNIEATQKALYHRACCDNAARNGEYNVTMETNEKK
ncbi:MAG: class I fructose-bisphosphate aldolase [Ginsengibacter sp.]